MKTAIATGQTPQDLRDGKRLIAGFIDAQVVRRGLDWRTGEAYRIDLEHFYKWLDGEGAREETQWQESDRSYSSRSHNYRQLAVSRRMAVDGRKRWKPIWNIWLW